MCRVKIPFEQTVKYTHVKHKQFLHYNKLLRKLLRHKTESHTSHKGIEYSFARLNIPVNHGFLGRSIGIKYNAPASDFNY